MLYIGSFLIGVLWGIISTLIGLSIIEGCIYSGVSCLLWVFIILIIENN